MRTDYLSSESEKKLDTLHNDLVNPSKNPYDDVYDYLYHTFANGISVDYHSQHHRPIFPEELDGIDGFDIFFKLLLDKDYLKLDSIYFDMNKEAKG